MNDQMTAKEKTIIKECSDKLLTGKLPPWKVELEISENYGIGQPENFRLAALSRRSHIKQITGESFEFIQVPDKPYKISFQCPQCRFTWELDARDTDHTCSICEGALVSIPQYGPLVSNYVGGNQAYYSYAGEIKVKGDIHKEFINLLVYGTGLGPIGITRGCHTINKLGGADIRATEFGRAVRCNGYIFSTEKKRSKAIEVIEKNLEQLKYEMNTRMEELSGHVSAVNLEQAENHGDYILFVDFVTEFENFRGHGDTSLAVGFAKQKCEELLQKAGLDFKLSVIAQGYDGDLKPSPRNKRGRHASAEIRIPAREFEKTLKVDPEKFLSFVQLDSLGANKLGCQFYSGMGGEIITAVYKATQVNPQSPLVSSFENIYARAEKGDIIYGVELPNIEVGIASCREGIISPTAREALRIMGIRTAREFASSLAAQVLAGEFNLALEISREKLYKS